MTTETEKTTVTEESLVKIGRSGRKTHIAMVTYEITNAGTPRARKRAVRCVTRCDTDNAGHINGRLGVHVLPGFNPEEATCEWCRRK